MRRDRLHALYFGPFVLAAMAFAAPAAAVPVVEKPRVRKTSPKDLAFEVERTQTKNGMVVLLSPDTREPGPPRSGGPSAACGSCSRVSSVVVDVTFRAGTMYEPPMRAGLAHLVEHLMMRGSTPETDYIAILESRSARYVNAYTTPDLMTFRSVVPREELPLALWVAADRLLSLADTLSDADLERERRVVAAERAEQFLDQPYAAAEITIGRHLHPSGHPMRGSVIGIPKELAAVTLSEVKEFVRRYLVPANGVVTVTGAFELSVAHKFIDETLGRLPPGHPAVPPPFVKADASAAGLKVMEGASRNPRVTFAWRISRADLAERVLDALDFGARMLAIRTSGSFGTAVDAHFSQYGSEAVFRLDATLPYEKPLTAAQDEAEVFLRYLTRVPFPPDLVEATLLAYDLQLLFALDDPNTRATLVTALETSGRDPTLAAAHFSRLWSADLNEVQRIAREILGGPRLILHAVPTNPRRLKAEGAPGKVEPEESEAEGEEFQR